MDWEIFGLSETHWCDAGELRRDGIQILCCGNESIHREGVAILISKSAQRSLIGYNPISARMISARLRTQIGATTIVQVYAPTSASSEEEIEDLIKMLNRMGHFLRYDDVEVMTGERSGERSVMREIQYMLHVKEVCDARDSMYLRGDRFVMREILYTWQKNNLWCGRFYLLDRREFCDSGDFICFAGERFVMREI